MTALLAAAALLVAVLFGLELVLGRKGFGTLPLFELTAHGVYRMRPEQAGSFVRRYRWRYDANGMRSDRTPPGFAGTTLLLGDSIVDGGFRVDQDQTLAALASRISGEFFYPVACHGWALANALAALGGLPGWSDASRLVFVLNSGDFDVVNRLDNELSFPTRRPVWLTLWLVRRQVYRGIRGYLSRKKGPVTPNEERRAANLAEFRELLANYAGSVVLVRYPMRGEDPRSERYFEQLASLDPRVRILEAADAEGWSEDCYADHMHPNARGLEVLARHLCQELS